MKKSVLLPVALLALSTTGCVNELLSGAPGTEVRFSANSYYENGPETKTAYSGELVGTTVKYERIDWVDGDKVRIYSPEAVHRYESNRHFTDYDIDAGSIRTNAADRKESKAEIVNEPGQNGLVWGTQSSYSFYALYPSPRKTGAYAGLAMNGTAVTAPLPSVQEMGAGQVIRDEGTLSLQRVVYGPDMNLAYMYAAVGGVSSGATVDLPFKPMMTAFEITLGTDNAIPLVVKDIFLFTDSTGSNLSGTFSGTINGTNTFTVSSVSGGSHELHAGLPEFAGGGTLTIVKGKPITFTLFALPINIEHLGLKLRLADDSFMSVAFKYKDELGGGWYPFHACKKYRITNLNTPEDETFTYTIEVFDPETGALIGTSDGDRMTLYGHDTVAGGFSVRSYRKSNLHPTTYVPLRWKIQYTTDNGTTWTDMPAAGIGRPDNATFSITSAPSGSGVDNTTYAAGEAREANIIGLNPNDQQSGDFGPQIARAHLQNAAPRGVNASGVGSPATAFDLSRHPVYGNIDTQGAQNTANCYVISAPGWYKFPLVYGNAIANGADNKSAYWPASATSTPVSHPAVTNMSDINRVYNTDNYVQHYYLPQFYNGLNNLITSPYILTDVGMSASQVEPVILWQDMEYLTDGPIVQTPASSTVAPDSYGLTTSGGQDYIWFKINPQDIRPGNLVIALRRNSGDKTILWSWHIWITDRDLDPAGHALRGVSLMPTNLGFIEGSDGAVEKYTDRGLRYRAVAYEMDGTTLIERADQEFEVLQVGDVISYLPSIGSNPYYQWGRKDPIIPSLPGGGSRLIIRNPEYTDLPPTGGSSIAIETLPVSNTANYAAGINKPYKPMFNRITTGSVGGPVYPYYKGWRLTLNGVGDVFNMTEAGWLNNLNVTQPNYWADAGGGLVRLIHAFNPGPFPTSTKDFLTTNIPVHFQTSHFDAWPYTAAERSSSALAYNLWNAFIYADNVNTADNKFKTIYDPCPPGFTVPVRKIFTGNTWPLTWEPQTHNPETPVRRELVNPMDVAPAAVVDRSSNKGVYYDGNFFPYTGGRILINTDLVPMEQGTGAYYWSDNPFNIQPYEDQSFPTDPTQLSSGGTTYHWFYQFGLILSTNRSTSSLYPGSEKAWSFTKGSGAAIRPMVDPKYMP